VTGGGGGQREGVEFEGGGEGGGVEEQLNDAVCKAGVAWTQSVTKSQRGRQGKLSTKASA